MATVDTANKLAILTVGRVPTWTEQGSWEGVPSAEDSGVSLVDADSKGTPTAFVMVRLRDHVAYRTVTLAIAVLNLADTYHVIVDGNEVTYDAGGEGATDEADVLQGIADAINADTGGAGAVVLATVSGSTVVLTGKSDPDYSVDWSNDSTGDLSATGDACSATIAGIWSTPLGATGTIRPGATVANRAGDWAIVPGSDATLDYRGLAPQRYDSAGAGRLYVQLKDVDGHDDDNSGITITAHAHVGPCGLE